MASIFFILILIFPSFVLSTAPFFTTLPLPSPGPESFIFDRNNEGPYTGISDGRIVKYEGPKVGFVDYGFSAPNRSKALCDGTNDVTLGRRCGRPLGLSYYYRTGEIYIAEAYYGICVIGPKGGLATQLATSVDGRPFVFPDGIEVDQRTGDVYMTDASAVYGLDQVDLIVSENDATGSLVKYDRRTKKVTTLMTGISGAAAVAISRDGSYLIVSEHVLRRLHRYWLRGPKANTSEIFMNMIGLPNKLVTTSSGDFWVAVTVPTRTTPRLIAQRFNGSGIILETVTFTPHFNFSLITEVYPKNDVFYLGSLYADVVGVYQSKKRQVVSSE